jgi:steroid 5-alpha reductase family enzyme
MLLFWLLQLKTKDASLVDVIWALSIFISTIYLFLSLSHYNLRHLIIALLSSFWSLRLAGYLLLRIKKSTQEDSRYQQMRQSLEQFAPIGFFFFYQAQAMFVTIFTTPIAIALMSPRKALNFIDIIGIAVFILAIVGESIADKQLMQFKMQNKGANKTCNKGLWYYSRHPNYFFEWVHWFAYVFFSYQSSYFWLSCLAPLVMLFFLWKVTGISHVEREALKKKPDYKEYIKTTSAFIPWFKKKN